MNGNMKACAKKRTGFLSSSEAGFFFFARQNDKENQTFKTGLDLATPCYTLTAQASKAVVTLNLM